MKYSIYVKIGDEDVRCFTIKATSKEDAIYQCKMKHPIVYYEKWSKDTNK